VFLTCRLFSFAEFLLFYTKNNVIAEDALVPAAQLAPQFKPLGLSAAEIDALTDFIQNALYDPNLARYEPSQLPTGLCFPNADPQSIIDQGCQ
jgi:cytochrome c peroxidase